MSKGTKQSGASAAKRAHLAPTDRADSAPAERADSALAERANGAAVERASGAPAATSGKILSPALTGPYAASAKELAAAEVAHDLNNLLCAIRGAASLGRRQHPDAPEPLFADIERLVDDASRLCELLVDPLKGDGPREPVDIDSLVHQCVHDFGRAGANVVVRAAVAAKGNRHALSDRGSLQRVLYNLLANAREASADEALIEVATDFIDDEAIIRVRDAGGGMDGATLATACQPFFTTKTEGTGLGLSSTREIVLSLGGRLAIETVAGEGTEVTLCLPLAPPQQPSG